MTNYGLKFNDTPRTEWELERLLEETAEQRKAREALSFLRYGHQRALARTMMQRDLIEAHARWARQQLADEFGTDRYPWEPRTPTAYYEPVPPTPKWLKNELYPSWWRRLWRWIDPRKQFRDWDDR